MNTSYLIRNTLCAAGVAAAALLPFTVTPARADALVIALDVSASSPILSEEFLRASATELSDRIRALPPGSRVRVFFVGDDQVRAERKIDLSVQRMNSPSGATAASIASAFPQALSKLMAEFKMKPAHRQSHLTTGYLDGVRLCADHDSQKAGLPRAQRCEIVMLSDGAQFERGRVQYPRDAAKVALTPVPGLDLKGVRVAMFGCGQGMESTTRVQVTNRWEKWFRDAGAAEVALRRL